MPNKRSAIRQEINPLEIHGMISISDLTPICDFGHITDASTTGFKIVVKRNDLSNESLRGQLNLDGITGTQVALYIPIMDLDITGFISRTKYISNKEFEIGIDYTADAPSYWRECLCDLLPPKS